jgi:two-component system response regulator DevR
VTRSRPDATLSSLSQRERDVLALITDGLTNKEIGERLFLSEKDSQELRVRTLGQARHAARTQPRSTTART